jgi:hypothetical protein
MSKWRTVLEAPRSHPFAVLLTHVPLLLFWIYFAVRDLGDGILTLRRGASVSQAAEPVRFYLIAALIVAVTCFIGVRIIQASRTLANR